MGTKLLSDVGVCAASFWRKIWTKGGWYFLLVALYYCKICFYNWKISATPINNSIHSADRPCPIPTAYLFLGMCLHFIPLHCTFASYFNLWGIPESIWHNLVHEIYEPRFEKVYCRRTLLMLFNIWWLCTARHETWFTCLCQVTPNSQEERWKEENIKSSILATSNIRLEDLTF